MQDRLADGTYACTGPDAEDSSLSSFQTLGLNLIARYGHAFSFDLPPHAVDAYATMHGAAFVRKLSSQKILRRNLCCGLHLSNSDPHLSLFRSMKTVSRFSRVFLELKRVSM